MSNNFWRVIIRKCFKVLVNVLKQFSNYFSVLNKFLIPETNRKKLLNELLSEKLNLVKSLFWKKKNKIKLINTNQLFSSNWYSNFIEINQAYLTKVYFKKIASSVEDIVEGM